MANEKNLRPGSMQSKSEVRENGRKGGIASGQARRRKKTLSELAKMTIQHPTMLEQSSPKWEYPTRTQTTTLL